MKVKNVLTAALLLPCLAIVGLITGCGGSSSTKPSDVDVAATGFSKTTKTTSSGTTVTSTDENGTLYSPAITLTVRSDDTIRRMSMGGAYGDVSWDEDSGDIIDESGVLVTASNPTESRFGFFVNDSDPSIDWSYQTYGIWMDGYGDASGSYGAISVGDQTPFGDVPTTGFATFSGITNGIYVDASGKSFITTGAATLNADFSARSIGFSTTGTQKTELTPVATTTAAPNLDMTGTLSYASGSPNFTGAVSSGSLSGFTDGRFYGPAANEAGGVYTLTGSGIESLTGAYGAKR